MVISDSRKQQILHDLVVTDAFERFLASKFPHNKVRLVSQNPNFAAACADDLSRMSFT